MDVIDIYKWLFEDKSILNEFLKKLNSLLYLTKIIFIFLYKHKKRIGTKNRMNNNMYKK